MRDVADSVLDTRPPTSRAKEVVGPKSPFAMGLFMHGARTTARCATGAEGQATTSKTITASDIAVTVLVVVMMALTVSALTTFAMSLKIAKSTPLTPTSNAATVLPLTITLTSKGC